MIRHCAEKAAPELEIIVQKGTVAKIAIGVGRAAAVILIILWKVVVDED